MTSAKDLIENLLKASGVGCKKVWVGRSGSMLLTFYSIKAARDALPLLAQFSEKLSLADGYDDTAQGYTRVWRVAGLMGA